MRRAKDFGLAADNVRFDAELMIKRSRDVAAARLSRGVEGLLRKNKVGVARRPNRPNPGEPDSALDPGDYSASLATSAPATSAD